mmetsp:Transcript_11704/g.24634  ORF Transcript_11704/g.24634 Transcript_11704/m.24634 type:complete len:200 (+) Transcript_11704:457-1056(+)
MDSHRPAAHRAVATILGDTGRTKPDERTIKGIGLQRRPTRGRRLHPFHSSSLVFPHLSRHVRLLRREPAERRPPPHRSPHTAITSMQSPRRVRVRSAGGHHVPRWGPFGQQGFLRIPPYTDTLLTYCSSTASLTTPDTQTPLRTSHGGVVRPISAPPTLSDCVRGPIRGPSLLYMTGCIGGRLPECGSRSALRVQSWHA